MSVVVQAPEAAGRRLLITKGAPEATLGLSTAFEAGGHVAPLDTATSCCSLSRECPPRIFAFLTAVTLTYLVLSRRRHTAARRLGL